MLTRTLPCPFRGQPLGTPSRGTRLLQLSLTLRIRTSSQSTPVQRSADTLYTKAMQKADAVERIAKEAAMTNTRVQDPPSNEVIVTWTGLAANARFHLKNLADRTNRKSLA